MKTENQEIYSKHFSSQFNEELEELRTDMMTMGGLVERQVSDAITALLTSDAALAEATRDQDRETNRHERSIDEKCTTVIALRQPAAVDLRLILSISRAVRDLERIGDEASSIARQASKLAEGPHSVQGMQEVRHIGNLVSDMLRDALTAFARRDMDLAYKVVKMDQQVDREYQTVIRSLITFMMEDPRSITSAMNVIWVLRSLERIGDHTCNLAEQLVYQVNGADVRHFSLDEFEDAIEGY